MSQNLKLAIVGSAHSILIYKSLGCETHQVETSEQAQEKVESLSQMVTSNGETNISAYGVIFVEENYYAEFPEDVIQKYASKPLPAIVSIPSGETGTSNFSEQRLKKIVEKAIGSDILG